MDRPLLNRNGFGLSRTFGSSMRPLIWGGRHCVVVVPLEGEPTVGDLLMFRQNDRNIVHRLVEIKLKDGERLYITRGDNCLKTETVRRDEIIGRVAEVHRTSAYRPWYVIPSKQFAVTDRGYRLYSRLWAAIWPVRRVCYLMRAHIRGLRSRFSSIFKTELSTEK